MRICFLKNSTAVAIDLFLVVPGLASAMGQAHSNPNSSNSDPSPKVKLVTDPTAPLALIYKGAGSCSVEEGDAGSTGYGCSEAAGDVASTAGFRIKYVGPQDLTSASSSADVEAIFKNAKVWMQPGGVAGTAANAMSDRLKSELVNFVSGGGGYFGICAGAFLATSQLGSTTLHGLGIFPGHTKVYKYKPLKYDYALLNVNWNGVNKIIYFEGGPYLYDFGSSVETVGTFQDGEVAAARTRYGKGRVFLTGPHVEAPSDWTNEDGIKDPDGSDYILGAQMLNWTAGITN